MVLYLAWRGTLNKRGCEFDCRGHATGEKKGTITANVLDEEVNTVVAEVRSRSGRGPARVSAYGFDTDIDQQNSVWKVAVI